jgi:hypothetical protein
MNFKQAMIVPTMASMGIAALLMAKNMSLMEASYADPISGPISAARAVVNKADRASAPTRAMAMPGMPAPGAPPGGIDLKSPEFGTPNGAPVVIRAITDDSLTQKAVAAAGREDPFMALVPDGGFHVLTPPVSFTPDKLLPPVIGSLAPPKPVLPVIKLKDELLTWGGDKAPPPQEPQWIVRGILSTGSDRLTLLEGKDQDLHAHVGDLLPDGSRVEAISSTGVTFSREGRRFVKVIGAGDTGGKDQ